MADNFNIGTRNVQDIIRASGFDPEYNKASIENIMATQATKQRQQEQLVAEAAERIKQAKLQSTQKQEAADAGVNPEFKGTLAVSEAVALLEANGVKQDQIDLFIASLGDQKRVNEESVRALVAKRSGSQLNIGVQKVRPLTDSYPGEDGSPVLAWGRNTVDENGKPKLETTTRTNASGPVFEADDAVAYAAAKEIPATKTNIAQQIADARKLIANVTVDKLAIQSWKQLKEATDPLTKSGQNALAMAGRANQRADRAMALLAEPGQLTWQRVKSIQADTAGIFQGGVPPIVSLSDQDVNTWKQDVAKFEEFFTGAQAEGLVPEDLQKQLFNIVRDIKEIDNEIINKELDIAAIGFRDVIAKDDNSKARWEEYKKAVLRTETSAAQEVATKKLFGGASKAPEATAAPLVDKKAALRAKIKTMGK